jgi:hypothetical protein
LKHFELGFTSVVLHVFHISGILLLQVIKEVVPLAVVIRVSSHYSRPEITTEAPPKTEKESKIRKMDQEKIVQTPPNKPILPILVPLAS